MTAEQKELAAIAAEMIIKHGVPAFMSAMRDLQTDNPTIEQIRALKDKVRSPQSYFDKAPDAHV